MPSALPVRLANQEQPAQTGGRRRKTSMKDGNVYAIITERILALLEKGTIPWQKPWATNGEDCVPRNLVTETISRRQGVPTPRHELCQPLLANVQAGAGVQTRFAERMSITGNAANVRSARVGRILLAQTCHLTSSVQFRS